MVRCFINICFLRLHFISGQYLSFDIIYILDYLSRTCLGFLIFIEVITALKHLNFNYYVYLMRMTLNIAGHEMLSCTFVISVIITAYSCFQYLTLGPYLEPFKDMPSAVITSIRIATAYAKMKIYFQTNFAETDLNKVMFVGFFFVVTLTLINIFISVINNAIESIKIGNISKSTREKIFDSKLNKFFWEKVKQIFWFVGVDLSDRTPDISTEMKRK